MAMTKCTECGQPVSTRARACPHCGAPPPATRAIRAAVLGSAVAVMLVLVVALSSQQGAAGSDTTLPLVVGVMILLGLVAVVVTRLRG